MKKRTMIFITAMVLLFAIVTGSTIAYMTDVSNVVTNTFTYGNIDIELKEHEWNGTALNSNEVEGNTYKLLADSTYGKDPFVRVKKNSEDCYLFVVVENGIANMEVTGNANKPTIATQMAKKGWVNVTDTSGVATNLWYYSDVIPASGADVTKTLFEKVYLNNSVSGSANGANLTVKIEAYAIQSANMSTAIGAYKAAGAPAGTHTVTWPAANSIKA